MVLDTIASPALRALPGCHKRLLRSLAAVGAASCIAATAVRLAPVHGSTSGARAGGSAFERAGTSPRARLRPAPVRKSAPRGQPDGGHSWLEKKRDSVNG